VLRHARQLPDELNRLQVTIYAVGDLSRSRDADRAIVATVHFFLRLHALLQDSRLANNALHSLLYSFPLLLTATLKPIFATAAVDGRRDRVLSLEEVWAAIVVW